MRYNNSYTREPRTSRDSGPVVQEEGQLPDDIGIDDHAAEKIAQKPSSAESGAIIENSSTDKRSAE